MPSALGRGIDQALSGFDLGQQLALDNKIPFEPEAFYKSFGYLRHPATGKPVDRLAPYQLESWRLFQKHRRLLEVKSHKVGETRKWLISDFQLAILPSSSNVLSCRGYDEIILAQTKDLAVEHLRHLRRAILRSPKYSRFLIDRPTEVSEYGELSARAIMRDERTKTEAIYLHNPEDATAPTRIIALGADNPGSIESWPNIKHLHISDITATRKDYRESLNIALTRLANTNGSCVIETIPGPDFGPVYEMWKMYEGKNPQPGDFCTYKVVADQAVAAGVISREFLESKKRRLGPLYGQYYGSEFGTSGNAWYDDGLFEYDDEDTEVSL